MIFLINVVTCLQKITKSPNLVTRKRKHVIQNILKAEILASLKLLQNGKSPGSDGLFSGMTSNCLLWKASDTLL